MSRATPLFVENANAFDQTIADYFANKSDEEFVVVYLYGNIQSETGLSVNFFLPHFRLMLLMHLPSWCVH